MKISDEKINRFLFWVIKIGIFAILFAPLIIGSHFYFPFIVPKNILFRVAVEIILLCFVLLALRDPKYRPKLNFLAVSVIIFFIFVTLSSLLSINPYRSFWGNYERMGGLFRNWHILAYFLVLISVFKEKRDWMHFFTFSIFAGTLMSIFALAQKINVPFILASAGGSRLTGTIGNPTYLAAYLLFNLFFILYFIVRHKNFSIRLYAASILAGDVALVLHDVLNKFNSEKSLQIVQQLWDNKNFFLIIFVFQFAVFSTYFWRKKKFAVQTFLSVLFIFQFLILYWTQTRGAMLGIYASVLLASILSFFFVKEKKARRISLAVFAVALVTPFFIYFGSELPFIKNQPTLNRLASISYSDITTQSRLLTWKASWTGWTENFLRFFIGYGDESYYYVFNKYFPNQIYKDAGSQIWFDRAHNIILDTGISYGLFGLFAYIGIFTAAFYALYILFKKSKVFLVPVIFAGLFVAYVGQNFFVFDTLNTYILFYLVLGFLVYLLNTASQGEARIVAKVRMVLKKWIPLPDKHIYKIIGVFVFIIVGTSLYSFNVRLLLANNYLFEAIKTSSNPNAKLEDVNEKFISSINNSVTGRYEARQQFLKYSLAQLRSPNIQREKGIELVKLADREQQKSIEQEPRNVRHYLLLGSFYNGVAFANAQYVDKSISVLKQGLKYSETRPHMYFELGQAYFIKGDTDRGLKYMNKGLSYAPGVLTAHFDALRIYAIVGLDEEFDKTMQYIHDEIGHYMGESDYKQVIDAYFFRKRYDRLEPMLASLIKVYPQSYNFNFGYADVLAKVGENSLAKTYAQKALEIDPSRQQDISIFLQKLDAGELLE